MQVLIFGFSVTADKVGYAFRVKEKLEEEGHSVDVVGIGGLHPNGAIYLVDELFGRKAYDVIALDILTSSCRKFFAKEENVGSLLYIIESASRHGATPLLLDLVRKDVDYDDDFLSGAMLRSVLFQDFEIARIAQTMRISGLDERVLKDLVHVNEEGTEFYTERVTAAINRAPRRKPIIAEKLTFDGNEYFSVPPVTTELFDRSGHEVSYRPIKDGDPLRMEFPENVRVHGFGCVVGPRTGSLIIEHSGKRISAQTFDRNCYYRRYNVIPIKPIVGSEFLFLADQAIPSRALQKGVKDTGPRAIDLVHLHIARRSLQKQIDRILDKPAFGKAMSA